MLAQFWRWWASLKTIGQQRKWCLKNFKFSRFCAQHSYTHPQILKQRPTFIHWEQCFLTGNDNCSLALLSGTIDHQTDKNIHHASAIWTFLSYYKLIYYFLQTVLQQCMFIEVLKFVLHFAGSDSHPQYGDVFKTGSSLFVTIFFPTLFPPYFCLWSLPSFTQHTFSLVHMPDVFSFPISLRIFLVALSPPSASLSKGQGCH